MPTKPLNPRTMSSPPSNSDPTQGNAFERLHPGIQRWIWEQGWTGLRDAQERALAPLLAADRDVIIAAATAAGKTEAAFLPILTTIANAGEESGLAIYISPLKALINDQWGRLDNLCEKLEIPVIPWHGDIPQSRKQKFLKHPRGVLLITPESLEAIFVRRGSQSPRLFAEVMYIVIDELHAFIGSDRGKQMQSLLYRIEQAAGRRIPRVGLSATLGDMNLAAEYLRPGDPSGVEMIVSKSAGQELQLQARGYIRPAFHGEGEESDEDREKREGAGVGAVTDHLYKVLRGTNNLVFPNSRRSVELYADALRQRCERDNVPVEFWPHHGSLSRAIREETEHALKRGDRPATAICTTTLELGIDIGAVKSIAQIGPAPSVASIRQRLGRSGRRAGEPAILRSYAIEDELTKHSGYSDRLREGLVQSIAMIRLLIRGWFEPPNARGLHLSTLVQQILSVIAEKGGAMAPELYRDLVVNGAFQGLPKADFADLLRGIASKELITQDPTGLILLGEVGERAVGRHDFYAAFISDEEWQILCQGQVLGSLPISSPLFVGARIIFAGRRWSVASVDEESKVVSVLPDHGGLPPKFDGGHASTHGEIRREMRKVLEASEMISFLDPVARKLLEEARRHYADLRLDKRQIILSGNTWQLFTWAGDSANDALVLLLRGLGIERVENDGLVLTVVNCPDDELHDALLDISQLEDKDYFALLTEAFNMRRGKWDWALPDRLLRKSFATSHLDFREARSCAHQLVCESQTAPWS